MSVIYRNAAAYELLMRALYGRHYDARLRAVSAVVPQGASVLELCCGPGMLYRRYLSQRARAYTCLDASERFTAALRRRGIDARTVDVASSEEPLPLADVAIIQASLYHFLPDAAGILDRMLATASRSVIVAEPIRNLASSRIPLLALLGRHFTDPGHGGHENRFTEATLEALMQRYSARIRNAFLIPGGREKVYVLAAGG